MPHGQSAAALLTSLLITHDELRDAEEFTDAFFDRESSAADPWQSYFLGDALRYGTLAGQLREAVR